MTSNKRNDNDSKISDDYLSSTISSSTLEIVLDDQSPSNSADEDLHEQAGQLQSGTKLNGCTKHRRRRQLPLRDPKSHRLIEKRRRDRMNAHLSELLQLTPHEDHDGQRRIEKTEIIEMAIKHMRHLISTLDEKAKLIDANINSYRTGYLNGLSDLYEFLDETTEDCSLPFGLIQFLKERERDLQNLTAVPDKKHKRNLSFINKRSKLSSTSQLSSSNEKDSRKTFDDDPLCVISEVEEYNKSPVDNRRTSTEPNECDVKVPIFVLHPSGTHYIPMCIDASVVSHALNRGNSSTRSSSTTNQTQCHPVSIPVNFNPITATSDSYELEIQNINVIGTRHQISVRPN